MGTLRLLSRKLFQWILFGLLFFVSACGNEPGNKITTPANNQAAPPILNHPVGYAVERSTEDPAARSRRDGRSAPGAEVPDYVIQTLDYIQDHGHSPEGYAGGRVFENREKRLPVRDARGQRIRYREWDVHPQRRGRNRGPERVVTGSNQKAYYTKDHYRSFRPLN